ncbi:MAG TPA: hypothetical protein VMS35_02195 [Nitrososphaeraceae archaeon]|nr:hypothetical protein [Nitrososphaeraceae archaeon]
MDIKDNLYSVLDDIGKESIQIEFQNDINTSIPKIKEILKKTIESIYRKKPTGGHVHDFNINQKLLSSLCEAFLHFLLTTSSLPSQRKIMLREIEIDLVIPDIKTFLKDPEKAIIIKFDKDSSTLKYINRLNVIQPNTANIWIVSSTPVTNYHRNYIIYINKEEEYSHHLFENKNEKNENYYSDYNSNNDSKHNRKKINPNYVPFNEIIVDIDKFLNDTEHKGLKFLPML